MKKIWLLKALGICLCVSASIFLCTTHCQPSYYSPQDQAIMAAGGLPSWFEFPDWSELYPYAGYYQPFNPYLYRQQFNSYVSPYKDGYNPYLDDDYEPPPDFSNWIWTDPWTAYDPSGGGAVNVNWQPEYIGTSPFFRQTGFNPWSQPYNYGWNMPFGYGWSQPYFGGYQQRYYPSYPYGIPYGNDFGSSPFGYRQPYNPYGYQQFFGNYNNAPPTNWSTSVIWVDEFSGYDPTTGYYFMI